MAVMYSKSDDAEGPLLSRRSSYSCQREVSKFRRLGVADPDET
jgi:hypothetical protein